MTRQDIDINGYWTVTVFYNVETPGFNQGFSATDSRKRKSVVVIGRSSSKEEFLNTIVHEAKHVQSSICDYYGVDENSEDAAYLIGHIVMRMAEFLNKS